MGPPPTNNHPMRDSTRRVFANIVGRVCTSPLRVEHIAQDLEIGVFNKSIELGGEMRVTRDWASSLFLTLYQSTFRSVLSNLDSNSYVNNKELLLRMLNPKAEFKPHDVAFMKSHDMFNDRWRDIIKLTKERDQYMLTARPAAMTDQFKCARCKGRECSYMELQTRSCDEPASIFITCHGCGNKWRIG
jgi:DNA-directed RNA polymerase subunit M/transcription elongation factor TFIIS